MVENRCSNEAQNNEKNDCDNNTNSENSKETNGNLNENSASKEEEYQKNREQDPFIDITPSLLNSEDVIRYVKATDMISNFDESMMKEATYTVRIGKYCYYWEDNKTERKKRDLEKDGPFKLKKDSIVFVELEPTFKVPNYIALRFNLKIEHVYKGLLLGTGPIVDPGFEGKLFIPLHNLTSNDYKFHYRDELIYMEFTKLSRHSKNEPIKFNKNPDRDFTNYIEKALKGTSSDKVVNSIPDDIKKFEEMYEKIQKRKRFDIVAGVVLFLTFMAVIVSLYSYVHSVNARFDNSIEKIYMLEKNVEKTQEENKELREKLNKMEHKNQELEHMIDINKLNSKDSIESENKD